MSRLVTDFTLAIAALVAACASENPYIPESNVGGTLDGRTAASYPLPAANESKGDLRVASYGISDISGGARDGKAIHLRLAIANHGQAPMTLDVREQRVQLPDGRQIAAAYAGSGRRGISPAVAVNPNSSRSFDLYFPLPEDLVERDQPPHFDVVWRVRVDGNVVSQITPFDEVSVDPAVARQHAAEDVLYGPNGYWYDPIWGPALIGAPAWVW